MKRTTKRRFGLGGLLVAGILLLMFVVSTKITVGWKWRKSDPSLDPRKEHRARSSMKTTKYPTIVGISIGKGAIFLQIPHKTNVFKGPSRFYTDAGVISPARIASWWPYCPKPSGQKPLGPYYRPIILVVPLWIPTLIIGIPSFLLWRRNRNLGEGYCDCGYNLTGNVSGVCPECGKKLQTNCDDSNNVDEDSAE